MVKHIVMWKIQGVNGQSKEETAQEIKRTLEDLNGKIEGLIHLEVGIDFLQSDASYDVVKPAATSRIVVDYEM